VSNRLKAAQVRTKDGCRRDEPGLEPASTGTNPWTRWTSPPACRGHLGQAVVTSRHGEGARLCAGQVLVRAARRVFGHGGHAAAGTPTCWALPAACQHGQRELAGDQVGQATPLCPRSPLASGPRRSPDPDRQTPPRPGLGCEKLAPADAPSEWAQCTFASHILPTQQTIRGLRHAKPPTSTALLTLPWCLRAPDVRHAVLRLRFRLSKLELQGGGGTACATPAGLVGSSRPASRRSSTTRTSICLWLTCARGRAGVVVGSATDAATATTRARAGGVGGRWTWGASRRCSKRTRLWCLARPMADGPGRAVGTARRRAHPRDR